MIMDHDVLGSSSFFVQRSRCQVKDLSVKGVLTFGELRFKWRSDA